MILRTARLWLCPSLLAATTSLFAQVPSPSAVRPVQPMSQPSSHPAADPMVDSFKLADGDIDSVLSALESFTGRTIVRPGQLPTATYSLRIGRPISKSELITALETMLELNGVSVTPMGERFLKVTALAQAKSEAPEMITGSSLDLPPSGRIVTKIFELNFLRVSEIVPQIQPFMTAGIGGGIVQLEKANVAMVTDTLENVQKVERLLSQVDQPRQNSLTPKFYQLHNAKASDLVSKIHTLLSGPAGNQLRATTTYTPDDRTAQIVVIADPREYPLFDSLISKLDTNADPNTRNEVIYLKHADAKDVSTLLSQLISGQNSAAQKAGTQTVKPATPTAPGGTPAAPGAAATTASDSFIGASTEFSTFVTIQPDERTNSVVVSGTVDDIRLIKSIVDKIDILLAQVRIEVVIAEVALNNSANSGFNPSGSSVQIGKAPNGGTSITNFSATVAGLGLGGPSTKDASGTVTASMATVNPLSVIATLTALGDVSTSKILQQSTIVTTHNKEATITVTDQVPIITGSTATPITGGTTSFAQSSSVTYKDIGITLKVTPLIGDDGSIQLKVDQTVDDEGANVLIDGNNQPTINHREATSFVNVMNDELVVLGGFQSTTRSLDRSKIGIMYEIPILSNLLGYRDSEDKRTELLLFLRPHVIKPDEGSTDTHRAINGMHDKEQLNNFLKDPDHLPAGEISLKEQLK